MTPAAVSAPPAMNATVDAVAACSAEVVDASPCGLQVELVGQSCFASLLSDWAMRPKVVPTISPATPIPPVTSPIVRCAVPCAEGCGPAGSGESGGAGGGGCVGGGAASAVASAASARRGTSI